MSKFIAGADMLVKPIIKQRGENGTMEFTDAGVGDNLVALFNALVRNTPKPRLESLLTLCYHDTLQSHWPIELQVEAVVDLIILIFQTRNCRGGKGERMHFYSIIISLYSYYPETTIHLLPLIAHYGYYKDYWNILEQLNDVPEESKVNMEGLSYAIIQLLAKQLQADYEEVVSDKDHKKVTLCAKYAPREGTHHASDKNKASFYNLLSSIYPDLSPQMRKPAYRKMITTISKHLDLAELYMCSHQYAELDFEKVPSVCNLKFRKAFLNEVVESKNAKKRKIHRQINDTTGDRHPKDADRIACRAHFRAAIKSKKVKGGQVYPHELVKIVLGKNITTTEGDLCDSQYDCIRQTVIDRLAAANTAASASPSASNAIRLDRFIPLVDVSGSMAGDPMNVAIALGILVSELTHPHFRNRVITFESNPKWCTLNPAYSFKQKVKALSEAPWGGSTNIEKAFELIIKVIVQHQIPAEDVPDLIILSDMQFDIASPGGQQTQYECIAKRFYDAGIKICGKPYDPPRIVFWNLRGDTRGHVATATTSNVEMLSGFSPAMLELVMTGEEVVKQEKDGVENEKVKVTPYDTFRKAVDHKDYDLVREMLSTSQEGLLQHYHFEKPVEEDVVASGDEIMTEG